MRIAVLCNDRIALPALEQLLAARQIVATGMPDLQHPTRLLIKARCDAAGVPLQFFHKKKFREELLAWLQSHAPDVVLVKTFPYLIPKEALAMPVHGFINFHYAPLPEWRGSNPLFWMIRKQATQGGITVHQMDEQFDTGPVLLRLPLPIAPDTSFGLYYTQLAYAGLHATQLLLPALQNGSLQASQQDHSQAGWYGRPTPADLFINWQSMSALEIRALVNACNPWNKGAATHWNGWTFGISHVTITGQRQEGAAPGTILSMDYSNGMTLACKEGQVIKAEVVYCEEGYYPGYRLSSFGLQKGHILF